MKSELFYKSFKIVLKVTLSLTSIWPVTLIAGNGMYMISHSGRYGGLAGATTALGGSVMDLHSSPALIGLNQNSILEAGIRFNYAENTYEDEFSDLNAEIYYKNQNKSYARAPLPYLGYSTPLGDKLAFATAFYLVGGGGGEFSGITRLTPNGHSANDYLGYNLSFGGSQKKDKRVCIRYYDACSFKFWSFISV